MKRTISWMLIFVLCLSSLALEGCGAVQKAPITVGQWLSLVNKEFGMESYITQEPYFENITSENTYFGVVQTAAEWGVVDTAQALDVEKALTWEQALTTLVNVGEFLPADSTKEEKIAYATEHFDNSIRSYWMEREIEADKAIYLLGIAQEQWANFKYDHMIAKASFSEDVLDFSREENKIEDYIMKDGMIAIPISHDVNLEKGDVFVLPANEQSLEVNAHKVADTYTDGEYLYIIDDEEIELEEIAEEIFVEGSYAPTMDQIVVYDGNGNLLSSGTEVINAELLDAQQEEYRAVALNHLTQMNENYRAQNCGTKLTRTFEVDGYKISMEYKLDGKLDLKISASTEDKRSDGSKVTGQVSASLSDFEITQKVDYSWFKLKEAMLKVDYKIEKSASFKWSTKPVDMVAAPEYSNGNGKFLTNFKRAIMKDKTASGAKTVASKKVVKVCSLNVYSVGVAKVCLDVSLVVGVDGSVTFKVTENAAKGIQYKDKQVRLINTSDREVDLEAKGKIEATVKMGPALYVIGLKKKLIGFDVQVGVGTELKATMHLVDPDRHLIEESDPYDDLIPELCEFLTAMTIPADTHTLASTMGPLGAVYLTAEATRILLTVDTCTDIKGYFILKLELSDEAYAKELLGGKFTASWEILGSKNAAFVHIHYDNGKWAERQVEWGWDSGADLCTLKFTPFEELAATATPEMTADDEKSTKEETQRGQELIIISDMKLNVDIGDNKVLNVEQIPSGYTKDDIVFSSGDSKIATVDTTGIITGVSSGNTMITISTRDGKYKIYCAVSVNDNSEVQFKKLDDDKSIVFNI